MAKNRPEISRNDICSSLWRAYETTDEFLVQKRVESINSVHPLVKTAEQMGLGKLIKMFIGQLVQSGESLRDQYEHREKAEWVEEWKEMHSVLFKHVLKEKLRGRLRQQGHDVRFGSVGDEDRHGIPKGGWQTSNELYDLADMISVSLRSVQNEDIDSVCTFLARVHYGFIRVHPFGDGNGRVARAVTDQLAISLGYPPIIAGFPRLDVNKKAKYHTAITGCIDDPSCAKLSAWIKHQIEQKIEEIA